MTFGILQELNDLEFKSGYTPYYTGQNQYEFKTIPPANHEQVCLQPPAFVGMCRAAFPRFSFYKSENRCKRFIYGGCDENENNFETEGHCKRVCIDKQKCPTPELQKPREGCRYDESLNERGCPKYALVCDVKPGRCPTNHAKAHQDACVIECGYGDDRCPGAEKCCKIGCNRICVPPVMT